MMGWQWHQLDHMQIICTSLHTDNCASTSPLSHLTSQFLQAGCPSCHPPNSVKALKVLKTNMSVNISKKVTRSSIVPEDQRGRYPGRRPTYDVHHKPSSTFCQPLVAVPALEHYFHLAATSLSGLVNRATCV